MQVRPKDGIHLVWFSHRGGSQKELLAGLTKHLTPS